MKSMNKIAFFVVVGFTLVTAKADFVQLPVHLGGYGSEPTWKVAEDFQFAQTSSVGKLIWWGGVYNPPPQQDTFTVQLYANVGGQPGGLLSGFEVGPITKVATGNFVNAPNLYPEYRYSADLLTPFVAQAGTTYWLSIIYSPSGIWLWEASTSADVRVGHQRSINGGAWEPDSARMAMQLVVVPEPSCALLLVGAVASCAFVKRRHLFR
jgi:hypothetical protein